jgi:Ser/Thr protein kinase RdoA (MazF antagonist)
MGLVDHRGVDDDRLDAAFLRDAGLVMLPGRVRPREGRAWLVGWQDTTGVLRGLPAADPAAAGTLAADRAWLHGFLAQLAGLGFPAPRPLPCFGGRSWATADGMFWEAVSFLPGHSVGWAPVPPLEEIGTLLGRYHQAAARIPVTSQRPSALPVAQVPPVLLADHPGVVPPQRAAVIRQLAARLAADLRATAHLTAGRVVIHGDFTADNVVADGSPPAATGVIDFAGAHAETPLADVAYGLWRSGRPHEHAARLDPGRVRRFLAGYASIIPVSPEQAAVIPVYLRGRGLQMIAKRLRAGHADTAMLPQVQWLTAHHQAVTDTLAAALR